MKSNSIIIFLTLLISVTSCNNYSKDPEVLNAISRTSEILAKIDSLNQPQFADTTGENSRRLKSLVSDSAFLEVRIGLTGNHARGFTYLLKKDDRFNNGFSIGKINDFEFHDKMLEAHAEKYVVTIEELRTERPTRTLKVLRISLVTENGQKLPFEVLYKLKN